MNIGANGIVVDASGQVLLIRRDDTHTLAPPGGALEPGELLTEGVVREVKEETGLKVLPVRLVGIYFWPMPPHGLLIFVFRCLQRSGQLATSPESPHVGYFPTNPLPNGMLSISQERVEQALIHAGGRPYWGRQSLGLGAKIGLFLLRNGIYRWKDWQRKRNGEPAYVPPSVWQVNGIILIQNEAGAVLWVKKEGVWQLPGDVNTPLEAPWETAVRATTNGIGHTPKLTNLSSVYLGPDPTTLTLVFQAELENGRFPAESPELAYIPVGQEPENSLSVHKRFVADAQTTSEQVSFYKLDAAA